MHAKPKKNPQTKKNIKKFSKENKKDKVVYTHVLKNRKFDVKNKRIIPKVSLT